MATTENKTPAPAPAAPPKPLTPEEKKTAMVEEYRTLLSQDQDEPSIVRALCVKYGVVPEDLTEALKEANKTESKTTPEPSKGPAPKSHK